MASIIISGDTMEDVPEVGKMLDDLLHGKISMRRFIKFLDDNNLETKVRCISEDINPSAMNDFIGETLSTMFSVPKNSDHENDEDEDNEEEIESENTDELWKKTNEEYKKHVKDTIEFAKRLIDDYGDSEEDDIDHTKAVKLFHSLMLLGRTYRQRAVKGDERYQIPNFTPENILKFIETLDLPTDKIQAALERGRSSYYKMKIYKSFEEFEKNMKDSFGIKDVWNPPKEVPEWFESVRNMQYRKFYSEDVYEIDEDEWKEFKKWKDEKDKEDIYAKANKLFRDILNIKPDLNIHELVGINELAMKGCVKGLEECLECLKKSKKASIINTILRNSCYPGDNNSTHTDNKNDDFKEESFEDQCRCIVNTIIDEFSPVITGKALKHFEKMYKSNDDTFMRQLRTLYNAVKSSKNKDLICFIDVSEYGDTIICNPIPNTKNDIEEKILNAVSSKCDSKESDKKSSTSKKTVSSSKKVESTSKKTDSSASAKKEKVVVKKPATKSKTDAKLKEFKGYSDYILLNSVVEEDARDLLLSYAANKNEKCKKLYDYLVDLKKKNKAVKLIKYLDDKTGDVDIGFTGIED